jgi:hypothetical protein
MLDDLARLYKLFSQIANGLHPIAEILRVHILTLGNEKIEQRLSRSEGKDEKELSDDPQFIKVYSSFF